MKYITNKKIQIANKLKSITKVVIKNFSTIYSDNPSFFCRVAVLLKGRIV